MIVTNRAAKLLAALFFFEDQYMRKRGNDAVKSIDVPVYDLNVSKIDTISQVGASLYEYIEKILADKDKKDDTDRANRQ